MTTITGPAIELMRWKALRSALDLELRTGMRRSSRGRSTVAIARDLLTWAPDEWVKSKRGVLIALDALISVYDDVYFPNPDGTEQGAPNNVTGNTLTPSNSTINRLSGFGATSRDVNRWAQMYDFLNSDLRSQVAAETEGN